MYVHVVLCGDISVVLHHYGKLFCFFGYTVPASYGMWLQRWIYGMCCNGHFGRLQLFVKHFNKHKKLFTEGLNYESPLNTLLTKKHCNQEWIKLLFQASKISQTKINLDCLNRAIQICNNYEKIPKENWHAVPTFKKR